MSIEVKFRLNNEEARRLRQTAGILQKDNQETSQLLIKMALDMFFRGIVEPEELINYNEPNSGASISAMRRFEMFKRNKERLSSTKPGPKPKESYLDGK